ncbi:MAG: hypothetical protein KC478_04005 [Bacteriovoracaceae bacterium]|nr:hypothetical protein [Bacteriovoracaceae bacterium]
MRITGSILLLLLTSCSLLRPESKEKKRAEVKLDSYRSLESQDFIDHLNAFEQFYLNSKEARLYKLKSSEERFLEGIANDIIKNNELFFTSSAQPTFKIVENSTPFHFSLPGLKIFISSGLISKYIKSEKLLYSVIAYELIRSEKNIYRKAQIIPTGHINTSRVLSLLRLGTQEKVETHKWAFYTLKRVGIDPDIYLSWLQIQNRNSLDFSLQLGDTSSISREESLFKAFIIERAKSKSSQAKYERSSREFYSFVNRIKR